MITKVSVFCGLILVLGGCAPSPNLCVMEDLTSEEVTISPVKKKPVEPKPEVNIPPAPEVKTVSFNAPADWFPPSRVEKQWSAIVIHHSATDTGNAAIFDRMHREENHWDGVGYDFVIGNGTDSGDGEIEVTFRWRRQVPGAHCGGTPDNWANRDAVGICLVGNFNDSRPTASQMKSLANLTRFLQNRYHIRTERIYGHGTTPGAGVTDCPGRISPVPRLIRMLGS